MQAFIAPIQRPCKPFDNMKWHRGVDLSRQLNETRGKLVLARLPGKIKRVYGYAVPSQARPRIKGGESKRLGLSRADDLPDVQAHALAEQLQFVHQSDIDAPIDVFEQLGHLRCARRTDQDRKST